MHTIPLAADGSNEVIIKTGEDPDADPMVLGRRGLGRVAGLLPGGLDRPD